MRINQSGITVKVFKKAQAIEALTDIKVWILVLMAFCVQIPNGAAGSFSTLVIMGIFNATPGRTLLLTMPAGIVAGSSAVIAGIISQRVPRTRALTLIFFCCTTLIACGIQWKLPLTNKGGLLAGVYLLVTFAGAFSVCGAWAVSNTAGATKKTVVGSLVCEYSFIDWIIIRSIIY